MALVLIRAVANFTEAVKEYGPAEGVLLLALVVSSKTRSFYFEQQLGDLDVRHQTKGDKVSFPGLLTRAPIRLRRPQQRSCLLRYDFAQLVMGLCGQVLPVDAVNRDGLAGIEHRQKAGRCTFQSRADRKALFIEHRPIRSSESFFWVMLEGIGLLDLDEGTTRSSSR
jgi:hypothetical protein